MNGKIERASVLGMVLALVASLSVFAQDQSVPKSLVRFANEKLVSIGLDSTLVTLVDSQNNRKVSLNRIKEIDQAWMAEKGISPFMQEMLGNGCSAQLKKTIGAYNYIVEAFVMDNQGALVGLTNKTSDYWQGDEAKFIESYKGGQGAVHFGKPEFDKSANATLIQISVPVMRAGEAIGAITFGVSIDAWEKR